MAVIRNLVVKISADVSELTKALGQAQSKLSKAASNIGNIGNTLATSITLPLMAVGGVAIKTATQFEQSMANAASVSNATGEEFERMQELARKMGKDTVFSASQAADAMYYMASAGYKVEQMADSIQPILDLAAATQSDLAFTTDTVIATLNQFGLQASEAGRVSNVFAASIGASQATMEKLSTAMGYVAPIAKSLGWSLEETTGALSVLYNAGYDGSTAGTALRKAMSSLLSPTTAAVNILKKLNISLDKVNPATESMADIVDTLKDAGMSAADALEVFGDRGGPGMMALISQGGEAISNMTKEITNTTSATTMAKRQTETFQGSVKLMQSQLEEVAITIGNSLIPMLSKLINSYVTPLIEKFNNLSQNGKDTAIKFGLIAASVGPLFLVMSKALKLISTLAGATKLLFAPLTGKIALVVGAVVLLVDIFKKLFETNEEFRNSSLGLWEMLLDTFSQLQATLQPLGEMFASIFSALMPVIESLSKLIFENLIATLDKILPIIQSVLAAFEHLFKGITLLINGDFKGAFEELKLFFINIWDAILQSIKNTLNIAISAINSFLQLIGKGVNFLIDAINKISVTVPDWLPVIGGKEIGFNIASVSMPQIPQLAQGGVIPPNNELLAILGDQSQGTNIEAPLDTIVSAFNQANQSNFTALASMLGKNKGEVTVRFEGLSENAFLSALTPKVIGKAKNMGLI
ncbi:MAG: phage tail tape measure protein [Clostridia bacterium]